MEPLAPGEKVRVARIISRLNVGGPAIQAISLSRRLEERGYETLLLRGSEGPDEGSMDHLAEELGVQPGLVASMRREVGPRDVPALAEVVRRLRAFRPHLIHTHAAKGGTLGRAAALLAFRRARRPPLVHTFHGHSLEGYFSPRKARVFLGIEQALAPRTASLLAVSQEVRADLVRLGVAQADAVSIMPLGFDLGRFGPGAAHEAEQRAVLRAALGLDDATPVVTLIARLVPIKRVDRFLRVARLVAEQRADVRFVIAGDGELRDALRDSGAARALGGRLHWLGFRRDIAELCWASDVVALTSDNEGTPVSLIEAQAAGRPVVSTDVGGTRSVIVDGVTGAVVARDDERGMAHALLRLLDDRDAAARTGQAGRDHVLANFTLDALVERHDALYRRLLGLTSPGI